MAWTDGLARRKFVTRFFTALGIAGTGAAGLESAHAQTSTESRFRPAVHPQDSWYDEIPGIHRYVFDTISPDGLSRSLGFANTYMETSKNKYSLKDSDSAVIVIVRNRSTRFGYNDAMWTKYGKQFAAQLDNFVDPKTKEVPVVNIHGTSEGTLGRLIQRGVHVAVCEVATRGAAGSLARALGGETDTYFKELSENLVPNGHLVPSGILALNRAQEHGYTVYAGG